MQRPVCGVVHQAACSAQCLRCCMQYCRAARIHSDVRFKFNFLMRILSRTILSRTSTLMLLAGGRVCRRSILPRELRYGF